MTDTMKLYGEAENCSFIEGVSRAASILKGRKGCQNTSRYFIHRIFMTLEYWREKNLCYRTIYGMTESDIVSFEMVIVL